LQKHLYLFSAIFVFCCVISRETIAQDTTEHRPYSERGFVGAPYARYLPETEWVGGLVGIYYFHIGPDMDDALTRPSNFSAGVSYSELHQSTFGIDYDLYAPRNAYRAYGWFRYQQFPLDYYGTGDYTPSSSIDAYTPLYRGIGFYLMKNILHSHYDESIYAGLEGEFRNDAVLQSDSAGPIASGQVPGARGGVSNGLGAIAVYDTRDNTFSTHSGQYASIDAAFYGHALGSDYSFSRFTADLRTFYPLTEDQTLAFQWYSVVSNGTIPFYLLRGLGGSSLLRGYYLLRFRDNDVTLLQSEWRFPIWWRFGGDIFAGAGEVGHTLSDFGIGGIHPSVGLGLRLLVIPEEHLTARVDYGFGTDSQEIYFTILEAF
jgi:outer membrane protein assembly factor BamA